MERGEDLFSLGWETEEGGVEAAERRQAPPSSWAEAPFSELADSVLGKMLDKAKRKEGAPLPYLRNINVRWGMFDLDELVEMPFKPDELDRYGIRDGDLIICEGGEPGRCAVWRRGPTDVKLQKALHRARLYGDQYPEFFQYQLQWLAQSGRLKASFTGTTIAHLPGVSLAKVRFRLPPAAEQRRIAEKIDSLFAKIEAGERALAEARARIARYRKAVLKAAVTGALTADWRAANADKLEPADALLVRILADRRAAWEREQRAKAEAKGQALKGEAWRAKYKEPVAPDTEELSELPEGWGWIKIGVAGEVLLGRQRAPQHHHGEFMRPYLRVANVLEARLDLSDVKEMNFDEREFEKYRLEPGDILLNEGQTPSAVGRPAMYRGEIEGCCFQKTLLRFRASQHVLPEFALCVFRSHMHTGRFKRSASITTNMGHLPLERIIEIEMPLPPLAEQTEIISRVSAALANADGLDTQLAEQEAAAKALRQSVLKAAFEGRLVPQDPADEPASALLARIRAERASTSGSRRGRSKTRGK